MNRVDVNSGASISFASCVKVLCVYSVAQLPDCMTSLLVILKEISTMAALIYIPTKTISFLVSASTLTFVAFYVFYFRHSHRDEFMSQCGFDLHFPDGE